MSHSTLTWFSGSIKPISEEEQFVIANRIQNGNIVVYPGLFSYDKKEDEFHLRETGVPTKRKSVEYWAYIPMFLEDHEGKS